MTLSVKDQQYVNVFDFYNKINWFRDIDNFTVKFGMLSILGKTILPHNHFEIIFKRRQLSGGSYRELLDFAVKSFADGKVDYRETIRTMEALAGGHDLILENHYLLPRES